MLRPSLLLLTLLGAACARTAPADLPAPELGATAPPGASAGAVEPAAPALLRRIGVLGASASAGFGLRASDGGLVEVAEVLDAALAVQPDAFLAEPWLMFFADPDRAGARSVEEVLAGDPTVVIAIDFLFWFAYGIQLDRDGHVARLHRGLALLDQLPCPIVVGDIPDFSHAVDAEVQMLLETQVPEREILDALNVELAAWAAARPRVHVLPLADFSARMLSGERIDLRGNRWENAADTVLQIDRLHPTLVGLTGLTLLALDILERAYPEVTADMVRWDAAPIVAALARPPAPATDR